MISVLKNLDWKLNAAVLFLLAAGLSSLFGASQSLFGKQLIWVLMGIILMLALSGFDLRPITQRSSFIFGFYFFLIALLLTTYFFAPPIRGVRSWLQVGGFQFQASEFMKIGLILLYALFFSRKHAAIARVSNLIVSFVYFLIPGALIALQPDLGTILVLFALWLGFLLVSGIRPTHLVLIGLIVLFVLLIGWHSFLEPYQKERILGVISPGRDPLGVNYSVIQAKVAIGSAGFFGKGFRQGTQAQLGFLTESKTDFIFSAIVEEWGLMAGILIVFSLLFAVFRTAKIGLEAPNNVSRFLCLGVLILWTVQFSLNVGSNLGLTPVVGVTFPFLSYGGSSLLTNFILLGIIQSISTRNSL
ncbi:rod shape-determining protein RodA [Candidatus Wolfebacteria bacterium]|nr:rod shape-determining protein RodA [Candidatus Wolfebacteria bacterium]